VPCILGTEFMDNHIEAIFTRLKNFVWQNYVGDVTENLKRTPILATLLSNMWERSWEDQPAKVRACRQVRVKGRMEEWVMATCATPGLVTISPNIRLCRHKSVAVARGVALVKPDESFLVKVCKIGPDQALVRKNSILGFAEPFQGNMLAAITEEKATQDTQAGEDTSLSDDPVEDVDISELCLVYLDDVIIFSASAEQHVKDVDVVWTRLRESGVTLNLERCTWFSDEVEYLGHNVRPGQLHFHNENVDALKHASFPTTKTQLKSFLGMCNVYRHFVKDFAKGAKPLNAISCAEVPPDVPKPTDAALAAFEDLRQALLAPPILALPKAKGQVIVDVDACADQLGCTLLQEQPDGTRLPVGYWIRGLSPAEKSYSTTERECLGVVWSVLKLRHFLDGHRCLIRTDQQALSWIYSTTDLSGRLMRWRLRLSEYTFDMQYKPCASHHAPDFLSRTDSDAAF